MGCLFPCFKRKKPHSEVEESLISDGIPPKDEESKLTDEQEFMNTNPQEAKVIPIKGENDKVSYPQSMSVSDFIFLKVF